MKIQYRLLPEKFHVQHRLCVGLIIEKLLVEEEYKELKYGKLDIGGKRLIEKDEDVLDYLLRIGEKEFHDRYLTNQLIHGLLIDTVYFIKEALSASTKKRLTVAFALLRKPFVYNLVVLLRVFFTSDFLEEFNFREKFDTTVLSKEDLLQLIELSMATLITNSINKDKIYDLVFNQDKPDSIINISNKALHPSTTRKTQNLSGIQNLNFIFSTTSDIEEQWDNFYSTLSVVLIYLIELCDFIICQQLNLGENFYKERISDRMKIIRYQS